jgi:hypothetical protein
LLGPEKGRGLHARYRKKAEEDTKRYRTSAGCSSVVQDPVNFFPRPGELLVRNSEPTAIWRKYYYILIPSSTLTREINATSIVLFTLVNLGGWQNDASILRRCAAALAVSSSNFGRTFVSLVCVVVN